MMASAAVVLAFELREKEVFVIISASRVRAVHVYSTGVKESALDPQPAHSFVDRAATDHAPLHVAHQDISYSQFTFDVTTLVDGMITSKRSQHGSCLVRWMTTAFIFH